MYPGKLLKLELEPDFGWLDILIAPFLPKIYAWFDRNRITGTTSVACTTAITKARIF